MKSKKYSVFNEIVRLAKAKNISVSKLSRMAGASTAYLSVMRFTGQKRAKTLSTYAKLADILEVPLYDLLFGRPDPHASETQVVNRVLKDLRRLSKRYQNIPEKLKKEVQLIPLTKANIDQFSFYRH